MTVFSSPYFDVMPARADIDQALGDLGMVVRDVRLFPFSACTPAFCVDLVGGTRRRVVLRGEQQNDLSVTAPSERSLRKEIVMLRTIRNLGLNAAQVLFEGETFTVPGYDQNGVSVGDFHFFLMEYVEGVAIDREIQGSPTEKRLELMDQIASIYARIHSVKAESYGLAGEDGTPVEGCLELPLFLTRMLRQKAELSACHAGSSFADEIRRFADKAIARLSNDIERSSYRPRPSLVLYDGFCGNMLINGRVISLIDMALAGYFEPAAEFCAFIFPLRTLLFTSAEDGGRYWDSFLRSYAAHGGTVPSDTVLSGILHVMFVNLMLHNLVYCAESRSQRKQSQVGELLGAASHMMTVTSGRIEDFVLPSAKAA